MKNRVLPLLSSTSTSKTFDSTPKRFPCRFLRLPARISPSSPLPSPSHSLSRSRHWSQEYLLIFTGSYVMILIHIYHGCIVECCTEKGTLANYLVGEWINLKVRLLWTYIPEGNTQTIRTRSKWSNLVKNWNTIYSCTNVVRDWNH